MGEPLSLRAPAVNPLSGADAATAAAHRPPSRQVLVNIVAFQLAWFALVLGAAKGETAVAMLLAAAVVGLHLSRAAAPWVEVRLIVCAVVIGAIWDSSLARAGWLEFRSGELVHGFAPVWILGLWAIFATTLNVSLRWLRGRRLLGVALGAVAGPLSYYAGARLGALVLTDTVAALTALAIGWAVLTPALVALGAWSDGMARPR